MYKISKEIMKEAEKNNINLRLVDEDRYKQIQMEIQDKFLDTSVYPELFLWEDIRKFKSISDANGWSYIRDFVKENESIMFFNLKDDRKAFYIENGEQLNIILGETSGYEFYLTNELVEYLICFTHHDSLVGCGTASEWIAGLAENR